MPVSYAVNPGARKLTDSKNLLTNQMVLDTRPGYVRYNSTQLEANKKIVSATSFKDSSDNLRVLAKCNTTLYSVATAGASTAVKTGLTEGVKHRAVNVRDRHIIAAGDDGPFQWDGTTFTQLGQAVPGAPTVAASGAGNTLTASVYQVAVTFYSTVTGFETNIGTASSNVTVSAGQQIDVTNIPNAADNATIDKVRVYVKDVTNNTEFIFWSEINLGITTETIDEDPVSTQVPPTINGTPPENPKFIAVFGKAIILAGDSSFPYDVFRSEDYLPDAFDRSETSKTIRASGRGVVTGIATGFFNDSNLNPFLCIFKRNSVEVYSEVGGIPEISLVSGEIGCISHDTIIEEGGVVYFMSSTGWFAIENGVLRRRRSEGAVIPDEISNNDLLDIFTRPGFNYELNKANYSEFFSVFYPTLKNYMTFVSEGANDDMKKCYNFEFNVAGFRPLEFALNFYCGLSTDKSSGDDIVLFGGDDGYLYEYSVLNDKHDVDSTNTATEIEAFCDMFFYPGGDFETSYNFGSMQLRHIQGIYPVTVEILVDYSNNRGLSFAKTGASGFILDISKLDEDLLTDGRNIVTSYGDVHRVGQALFMKFKQTVQDDSMALMGGQIHVSKNGSPN